jgi:cardiolipin synthase
VGDQVTHHLPEARAEALVGVSDKPEVELSERVSDRVVNVPNAISAVRLVLIPIFAWLFLRGTNDGFAVALMVIIGVSDFLDGFIARRFDQVTKLGKILDPIADRAAVIVIMLAMVFRGTVSAAVAVVILLRDAIVSVVFPLLEAKGYPRIPVNRTGKNATALIFSGMAVAVVGIAVPSIAAACKTVSAALLVIGAFLYWAAAALYGREIRKLVVARRGEPVEA